MQKTLIIVDDFLDNAADFRNMALKLDYPEPAEGVAYPGRNSAQRINLPGLGEQATRIIGTRLRPKENSAHGRFRITLENDEGIADVHIDESHWSGIYYASRPEDCRGGTEFFRHRETGTERGLLEPEEIRRLGAQDEQEANRLFNEILFKDSKDRSKWEHIMTVPMKFNRLVLFRPWLWHTASPGFGDSLENGRLVYLLFFERY